MILRWIRVLPAFTMRYTPEQPDEERQYVKEHQQSEWYYETVVDTKSN